MSKDTVNITADAIALQERDEFREQGWLKLIAPAKVNLYLAIGARRPDGYHEAETVMHALNLHDVVYMRQTLPENGPALGPETRLVGVGDVEAPNLESSDNVATKAVQLLGERIGREDRALEIRIEKNIPSEAGLGGGSSDAAAVLVGAAQLWGLDPSDPAVEKAAQDLGSDVAFFLRGGCAHYAGTGEVFVRSLEPAKCAVALVKPQAGVSTMQAYETFDENPTQIPESASQHLKSVGKALDVTLLNNLAPASETLLPELGEIRRWLCNQAGVEKALLCGSGATTFATCRDFAAACSVVAEARKLGYWARATSLGSARAMAIST